MRRVRSIALFAVGCCTLLTGSLLCAQEREPDKNRGKALLNALARQQLEERRIESPTPFINLYHPDWPIRGRVFDHLDSAPYTRFPKPAYKDSLQFRAWFPLARSFNRRARWPYERQSPELQRKKRR